MGVDNPPPPQRQRDPFPSRADMLLDQRRRAQCGEVWLSPYLGPAHSGNIHRPMKKVLFTSLTLAAATSSVRPSRPHCAPRRRAPNALVQIPARCSGALALRPSGPDAPGLGTSLPPRLPAAGWHPRRSGPTATAHTDENTCLDGLAAWTPARAPPSAAGSPSSTPVLPSDGRHRC